jgi:hypothetical protein
VADLDVLRRWGDVGVGRKLAMRRAVIAGVTVLLAIVTSVSPCHGREPYENQWGPFTGTVVDAGTGQPIPGAVFTVIWVRWIPMIAERWEYFYDARVAVADEAGRFEIPRRFPALLGFLIDPVRLSCVAPGYAPYRDVGTQSVPIQAKLRPLNAEERRLAGSFDEQLVTIPHDRCLELEDAVNERRQRMRLPPVGLCSGNIDRVLQ